MRKRECDWFFDSNDDDESGSGNDNSSSGSDCDVTLYAVVYESMMMLIGTIRNTRKYG